MDYKEFDFLRALRGQNIQVDRGGPESQSGRLVSVQWDHLVLEDDEGNVCYCRFEHIKSVSTGGEKGKKSDKKSGKKSGKQSGKQSGKKSGKGSKRTGRGRCGGRRRMPLLKRRFCNLMWALEGKTIQVNRGGPEKVQGTLKRGGNWGLVLGTEDEETINVAMKHVRSIQWLSEEEVS